MKLVILIDNKINLEQVLNALGGRKTLFITTEKGDICHQYEFLINMVENFEKSDEEILLAVFSGKDSVARMLGDECPNMIVTLTTNENSEYYNASPIITIEELISNFR